MSAIAITKTIEKPIIFSPESVQQILAGAKSQTRRIIKPQPTLPVIQQTFFLSIDTWMYSTSAQNDNYVKSRYGVRDSLWVRETFRWENNPINNELEPIYKANLRELYEMGYFSGAKWKSPIHMPRRTSRLSLKITNIHVEQLCGISEADAIAEGCKSVDDYARKWNVINGKSSWSVNPWVWVISFKRIDAEGIW